MKSRTLCAPLIAAAAIAAAAEDGSVDLELRGNEKISGTLRPAFATESFACRIPRGAALSAVVKTKLKGLPAPPFEVGLTRDGSPEPGAVFAVKGPARTLAGFGTGASGLYRVVVTGDGVSDGDYDFSLSVKPAKSFSGTGASLDAGAEAGFTFGAPAGALATITLKPAPGSPFVGAITRFVHPSGAVTDAADALPKKTFTVLGTGDAVVQFDNAGATGGWSVGVKLKLPKTPKGKIDIRDGALTTPFGAEPAVFGRVLGTEGGALSLPGDAGPLSGSSISIPPGVLAGALVVTISSAPPLPGQDGGHAAGPAVEYGPSGTVFDPSGGDAAKQATLTVPFDPDAFPNGTDSLVVYVRDAAGNITEVPRPYVIGDGTVSFAAAHLSSYQAQSPDPRPFAGEFVALDLVEQLEGSFGGSVGFGLHSVQVDDAIARVTNDELVVAWQNNPEGGFVELQGNVGGELAFDAVVDPADDSVVTLTDRSQQEPPIVFRRGVDGDVLLSEGGTLALLRRAEGAPSVSRVAGRWHLFHLSVSAEQFDTAPATARLEFGGDRGVLDLLPDGSVRFLGLVSVYTNSGFPAGTWTADAGDPETPTLAWRVEDGTIRIGDPGDTEDVRLFPVARGDILVGRSSPPLDPPDPDLEIEFFFLVRATSRFSLADAVGDYFAVAGTLETRDGGALPQGVNTLVDHLTVSIPPSGAATHAGTQVVTVHDGDGIAVSTSADVPVSSAGRFQVKRDGSFTTEFDFAGAFTPDGLLYVRTRFIPTRIGFSLSARQPSGVLRSPR